MKVKPARSKNRVMVELGRTDTGLLAEAADKGDFTLKHILVPVDAARLDRGKKNVVVDGLFSKDLGSVPVYSGLPLSPDTEREIRDVYRAGPARTAGPGDVREAQNERRRDDDARHLDRFYGSRREPRTLVTEGESTTLSNASTWKRSCGRSASIMRAVARRAATIFHPSIEPERSTTNTTSFGCACTFTVGGSTVRANAASPRPSRKTRAVLCAT